MKIDGKSRKHLLLNMKESHYIAIAKFKKKHKYYFNKLKTNEPHFAVAIFKTPLV